MKNLFNKLNKAVLIGLLFAIFISGSAMAFTQMNLVSNTSGLAKVADANVINSWGIAHLPTGPWFVADNGMGVSTVYDGNGEPSPVGDPLIITVPGLDNNSSSPTGLVANNESEFNVTEGNPAQFIFVTEDGTISAWNPNVDPTKAVLMVNNSPDAIYKGVTIGKGDNGTFLYTADFHQGRIDVFDTDFKPVTMGAGAFVDSEVPAGFAPFNIQMVNGSLVVTFAQQDSDKKDEVDGPGLGYVDIFDPDGKLVMRMEHGDWLDAPWGATMAPANFGNFSNDLLIGNFGSGQISAFDPDKGSFKGLLDNESNEPINISGLWGLEFGNDADAGSSDTLFFAAGINKEQDGLFGNIAVSEEVPVTPPTGKTWNVDAGGQTNNMAIQGMAFYPGIITINVGDTIKWNISANFHTISFLSGTAPPPEGSPQQLSPSGGLEYGGTGFVSSGILPTGGNYALTFTKEGIFDYRCLIHPGMQGVVIVQPSGSDYPLNQSDYNDQGQKALEADLEVGRDLTTQVRNMVSWSPGPNGTTSWETFADIPLPEMVKVRLRHENSSVRGRATLNMTSPADLNVQLKVSGLEPDSEHMANIKIGTCDTPGSTVFTIGNFNVDSSGEASLATDINVTPPFGIMNRGWIVDVDNGSTESAACGNVVKHDAARMRFATRTLTIDQGDTVTWTQLNPMEIHTITFLAEGQKSPELLLPGFIINPEAAGPSGTGTYNGTGYYNSGILIPGASYNLTFSEPGRFRYECVIHDEMKMIGYIKVNPRISGEVSRDVRASRDVEVSGDEASGDISDEVSGEKIFDRKWRPDRRSD